MGGVDNSAIVADVLSSLLGPSAAAAHVQALAPSDSTDSETLRGFLVEWTGVKDVKVPMYRETRNGYEADVVFPCRDLAMLDKFLVDFENSAHTPFRPRTLERTAPNARLTVYRARQRCRGKAPVQVFDHKLGCEVTKLLNCEAYVSSALKKDGYAYVHLHMDHNHSLTGEMHVAKTNMSQEDRVLLLDLFRAGLTPVQVMEYLASQMPPPPPCESAAPTVNYQQVYNLFKRFKNSPQLQELDVRSMRSRLDREMAVLKQRIYCSTLLMTSAQCFFNKLALMNDYQLGKFLSPSQTGPGRDNPNSALISHEFIPPPDIDQDRGYCLNQYLDLENQPMQGEQFYYATQDCEPPPLPKILKIEGNRVITTRNVTPLTSVPAAPPPSPYESSSATPYQRTQLPPTMDKRLPSSTYSGSLGTNITSPDKRKGPSKAPLSVLGNKRYGIQYVREQPLDDDMLDVIRSADLATSSMAGSHATDSQPITGSHHFTSHHLVRSSRATDLSSSHALNSHELSGSHGMTPDDLSDALPGISDMVVASCEDIVTSHDDLISHDDVNAGVLTSVGLTTNQDGAIEHMTHQSEHDISLNDSVDSDLLFTDMNPSDALDHHEDHSDPFSHL